MQRNQQPEHTPELTIDGKVAVITGASQGLGAGLAAAFAARGMHVALCARRPSPMPAGAQGFAAVVDVTDAQAVRGFADQVQARLGAIDLWINNAGVLAPIGPMRGIDPEEFLYHLHVNVMGVVYGSQAYAGHVRQRAGTGVLVNISSGAAWQGYAGWSAYCASKAAVERMSEALQEEEQEHLRVYAVAPGIIDTEMQTLIRACTPEQLPSVGFYRELKAKNHFNTPGFVAGHLLRFAFDPSARPAAVAVELPREYEE